MNIEGTDYLPLEDSKIENDELEIIIYTLPSAYGESLSLRFHEFSYT